ncbi:hypothetical protein LWI28_005555 [Acer negundo]|uniref:Uncharacterized protein n=1 Tax=Acer negundo TaxID=4023 RepID=A0AAD5P2Q4_ACENE|nr:hypothetical protein LWI28_005555 [Acer negundo]
MAENLGYLRDGLSAAQNEIYSLGKVSYHTRIAKIRLPGADAAVRHGRNLHMVSSQAMLTEFAHVFATPTVLPPMCDHDHQICLQLHHEPVGVRPYEEFFKVMMAKETRGVPFCHVGADAATGTHRRLYVEDKLGMKFTTTMENDEDENDGEDKIERQTEIQSQQWKRETQIFIIETTSFPFFFHLDAFVFFYFCNVDPDSVKRTQERLSVALLCYNMW